MSYIICNAIVIITLYNSQYTSYNICYTYHGSIRSVLYLKQRYKRNIMRLKPYDIITPDLKKGMSSTKVTIGVIVKCNLKTFTFGCLHPGLRAMFLIACNILFKATECKKLIISHLPWF